MRIPHMLDTIMTYPLPDVEDNMGMHYTKAPRIAIISEDGSFLGWQANSNTNLLPKPNRSVNVQPLPFDHAEYMLGFVIKDQSARAELRHAAYVKLWESMAATDDALTPVVRFLSSSLEKQKAIEGLPANPGQSPQLYRVERDSGKSEFLHARPSIKTFWQDSLRSNRVVEPSECKSEKTGSGKQCMVCLRPNQEIPKIHKVSTLLSASSESFHSYGWDRSENIPVCWDCIEKYDARWKAIEQAAWASRFRLTRKTTTDGPFCVFWGFDVKVEGEEDLERKPNLDLPQYLARMVTGQGPNTVPDGARFRGIIWHKVQKRYVTHRIYDEDLGEIVANAKKWFESMLDSTTIVKYPKTISQLCRAFVPKGLPFETQLDMVNPLLEDQLLDTAFYGTPLPRHILQNALQRYVINADAILHGENPAEGNYEEFAIPFATEYAMLTLALNYAPPGVTKMPVPSKLDTTLDNPSYLAGRLFRCMEQMQYLALGRVNSGIVKKHFSSFVQRPFYTLAQMEDMYQKHMDKALRSKNRVRATYLSGVVRDIQAMRPATPEKDRAGNLYADALAIKGYYHQDAEFRIKPATTSDTVASVDLEDDDGDFTLQDAIKGAGIPPVPTDADEDSERILD